MNERPSFLNVSITADAAFQLSTDILEFVRERGTPNMVLVALHGATERFAAASGLKPAQVKAARDAGRAIRKIVETE